MSRKTLGKIIKTLIYIFIGVFLIPYFVWGIVTYPPGALLQTGDITSSHIRDGAIINADVSSTAAIDFNKTSSTGRIANIHVSSTAAIDYSKLNLTGQIVNADVSSTAAIADTKLAQITTAGKVSGAALTSLSSIPAGAGVIPTANVPGGSPTATTTAGQDLSTSTAIYIENTTRTQTQAEATSTADGNDIGNDSNHQGMAQAVSSTISVVNTIKIGLKKTGSPSDNFIISFKSGASAPGSTEIASTTIAGSSITTVYAEYTLSLSSPFNTVDGTTYWIHGYRSGATDGTNYYTWAQSLATNPYNGGNRWNYNGTSWAEAANTDAYFKMTMGLVNGNAYLANASATSTSNSFIGFVKNNATYNSTVTFITAGTVNDFTNLAGGNQYYLSNTAGNISTTAGTVSRKVGISVSTSTLVITNIW